MIDPWATVESIWNGSERKLRAAAWTLREIADELRVSKGSVSVWVRDVEFVPKPRNRGHDSQRPHPLHVRKLEEIERCRVEAEALIGTLSERDLTMFCLALYAGEGSKTEGAVKFANTSPTLSRAVHHVASTRCSTSTRHDSG